VEKKKDSHGGEKKTSFSAGGKDKEGMSLRHFAR